jgi:hypothetical protein
MPDSPVLRIDIELQAPLLLVTATGNFSFETVLRLLKQACATTAEKPVNKILVNALAMVGEISTFEGYSLGGQLASYVRQRQPNLRLALVGKPPTVDGFAVRVGQNRGISAELFSSEQEALNWLAIWPS